MTAHGANTILGVRALIAVLSGLLDLIAVMIVPALVGHPIAVLPFAAGPIFVAVALVLAAIELAQVRSGRANKDYVALAVIAVTCSILAGLECFWLLFWIAAA